MRGAPDIDIQLQKHKKKTVRELRLPEPLHLIGINIASFTRFSRQKLAFRSESRAIPRKAASPHCDPDTQTMSLQPGLAADEHGAPDGAIWLLTDEDDGHIIRISRAD
jgi:hypothetical protein